MTPTDRRSAAVRADEALSGLQAAAYRDRPTRAQTLAEQLAAEDERARLAMGENPYPAGDQDEV